MIVFKDAQKILDETSLVANFLEIVKIDTQSDEASESCPSTDKQLDGLKILVEKLKALGLKDATVDENGYLFATMPANVKNAPTIGLLAHIDTAPDYSGTDVNPQLHKDYQGGAIELKNDITITPAENPELEKCIGDTIITADGTTLLGADDKAGIAEILAVIEILQNNPDIPRPTIRVGFTPDEEIGRGSSKFDIEAFGADCAYTLDGGWLGEINSETFSADGAVVKFTGVAVHPGYAKGKLVNALKYAAKFVERLPHEESPEMTENREGFYHVTNIEGNSSEAKVSLILRDFEVDILKTRGEKVNAIAAELMQEAPGLKVEVEISETYRNMAYWLKDKPEIIDMLEEAVKITGIAPDKKPIRGGTDGSGLTAKGLPTPNIFAGGLNFHGPREWVSTRVMALTSCTVLNLLQKWAEK